MDIAAYIYVWFGWFLRRGAIYRQRKYKHSSKNIVREVLAHERQRTLHTFMTSNETTVVRSSSSSSGSYGSGTISSSAV